MSRFSVRTLHRVLVLAWFYDNLQADARTGTGKSLYSGLVLIGIVQATYRVVQAGALVGIVVPIP